MEGNQIDPEVTYIGDCE